MLGRSLPVISVDLSATIESQITPIINTPKYYVPNYAICIADVLMVEVPGLEPGSCLHDIHRYQQLLYIYSTFYKRCQV